MNNQLPDCPIHPEHKECPLFWEFEYGNKTYQLFKCDKCDHVFYDPFPVIDYQTHTDSIPALQDYVHLNVNIEGLISTLVDNIPAGDYKSMLEVGCGFGFTIDFAKRILHMDVVGYEPSLYGEVGSSELKLDIRRRYLTKEDLVANKYDVIFLSEVLEHIEDPVSFINLLKSGLSDKGVLILTTPDYKKLAKDLSIPTDLALLSPGAHVILFGQPSLEQMLRDAGFRHVKVTSPGSSLVAVSSTDMQQPVSAQDKIKLIRTYYTALLDDVHPTSFTYAGIIYRLLRNYVDNGDYEAAHKMMRKYPFPLLPSAQEIQSADSASTLDDMGLNCASMLYFYFGIMRLNYYNDPAAAATDFQRSFELCEKRLLFVPNSSVLEYGIIWLAKYHEALSLFHARDYQKALTVANSILRYERSAAAATIPVPDHAARQLAGSLVQTILEKI